MGIFEKPSPEELIEIVQHFTADIPVVEVPGPTRFSEAQMRGFTHVNPNGMFMLGMVETTLQLRNKTARRIARLMFKPRPNFDIAINDLNNPEQSRSFSMLPGSERVIVVQGSKAHHMNEEDVAELNRVFETILPRDDAS